MGSESQIIVVFRDDDFREYNNASKAFEQDGKVLKIKYNNNKCIDYIPLINIKTITVKAK